MNNDIESKLTSIFFGIKAIAKIGSVQLDCSIQETHSFKSDVTDYTVEDGGKIQDHIYLEPFRITMQGIVSDSPLGFLGGGFSDTIQSYSEDAYDKLTEMREQRILFDVVTGLKIYPNMVFETLDVNRDKDTGKALYFTSQLKQIRKAQSKVIYINGTHTNNKNFPDTQNQGNQPVNKIDPEAEKKKASIAARAVHYKWPDLIPGLTNG
jgi:hypothetical protein